MRPSTAEFASKFAAYSCMVIGLSVGFAGYRDELLTYVVMACGLSMFAGGWYWLVKSRRKYG
jgi:hypothetical protein